MLKDIADENIVIGLEVSNYKTVHKERFSCKSKMYPS